MAMQTVFGPCGYCSGSGNDPATGRTGGCTMCGGSGMRSEQVYVPDAPVQGTSGGGQRTRGGGQGGSELLLGLIGLVFLAATLGNYVLTADLIVRGRENFFITRQTDWIAVGIVASVTMLLVGLAARRFGVLAGLIVGAIPTIPAMIATQGGIGVYYIVFNAEEASDSSAGLAWVLLLAAMAFHLLLSIMVQPEDRGFWGRIWTTPHSGSRLGLTLSLAFPLLAIIFAVVVLRSVQDFL